jgi:predicted nucleic acid-binding Zn ribbon protein
VTRSYLGNWPEDLHAIIMAPLRDPEPAEPGAHPNAAPLCWSQIPSQRPCCVCSKHTRQRASLGRFQQQFAVCKSHEEHAVRAAIEERLSEPPGAA